MPESPAPVIDEVVIAPSRGWLRISARELWKYRDLFWQFVRRDFATRYRQTLLGPLWFVLQPLMLTAVFAVVFGRMARLPTDHSPPVLFYLCGLLSWTYFAQTLPAIAGTFSSNSHIFGKIYFPRLIVPLSVLAGNLAALLLQFVTFGAVWFFYRVVSDFTPPGTTTFLPALGLVLLAQLQIMVLALGIGALLAAATGKYRDLQHVLPVMMQLWFYATPVVYPLSMISESAHWRWVMLVNPMTAPAEAMRLALLGASSWNPGLAASAWGTTLVLLLLGLSAFSRAERTVIDVA